MKTLQLLAILGAFQWFASASFAAALTFSFAGQTQFFQIPDPDLDFLIGDEYTGTYTFDSDALGVPSVGGSSLTTNYPTAVTSWSVTFPRLGLRFGGNTGEITIGNDTAFFNSDRYVVTLFAQGTQNPLFRSGRSLRYMQIDLFDIEGVSNPPPADLLSSTAIPTTPPDLNRISAATQGSAIGRVVFNENNNQLQTRTTALASVPEPGNGLFGALISAVATLSGRTNTRFRRNTECSTR